MIYKGEDESKRIGGLACKDVDICTFFLSLIEVDEDADSLNQVQFQGFFSECLKVINCIKYEVCKCIKYKLNKISLYIEEYCNCS